MSKELFRHVNALVSDFAAKYGDVDLVGRRIDCEPEECDALLESYERFGVGGGAGVHLRDDERLLLARYEGADGWVDPGDGRRPGESFRECAVRGIRQAAGIDVELHGLARIHLLYFDDWTDRDPAPNPYVAFEGRPGEGADDVRPGEGVAGLQWSESTPDDLLYDELAELSLRE